MRDVVTATPVTIRRSYLPRVMLPNLAIGATVLDLIKAMGIALNMTYVAPCGTIQNERLVPDVANLNGRDPNW